MDWGWSSENPQSSVRGRQRHEETRTLGKATFYPEASCFASSSLSHWDKVGCGVWGSPLCLPALGTLSFPCWHACGSLIIFYLSPQALLPVYAKVMPKGTALWDAWKPAVMNQVSLFYSGQSNLNGHLFYQCSLKELSIHFPPETFQSGLSLQDRDFSSGLRGTIYKYSIHASLCICAVEHL